MLTDLDKMAMAAMQGICASGPTSDWTNPRIAKEAYDMATEMMAERVVRQPYLAPVHRDASQP